MATESWAESPVEDEAGAKPLTRVDGQPWTEGPTVGPDGLIYFADVKGDQILVVSDGGGARVFRRPANFPNGMVVDDRGRLVICELGGVAPLTPPRLTRTDLKSGRSEVLADNFAGLGLLGPNDVSFDNRGRLYFTDFGRAPFIPPVPQGAPPTFAQTVDAPSVYRLGTEGRLVRLLGPPDVGFPNGLVLSPDDRTLYVIDRRLLLAFDLSEQGAPRNRRVIHDFSPGRGGDGMTVDAAGNLWVAAGQNVVTAGNAEAFKAGVHVFAPDGRLLGTLAIPEDPVTNVAFGGPDLRTLYVTAGKTLYRARTRWRGTRR